MKKTISFELAQQFPNHIIVPPVPSRKLIPPWFKKMKPFSVTKNDQGQTMETVKKCVPFIDAMSAGYTFLTHVDLQLTIEKGKVRTIFLDERHRKEMETFKPIETHPKPQVEGSPFEDFLILKFISPWRIKVPKGYSCLFLPPMNQFELSYIPLCGIVDSDNYEGIVNFPFIVPALQEGVQVNIPAGSPFIQIIPYKREEWVENVDNLNGDGADAYNNMRAEMRVERQDYYRKNNWDKKKFN